MKRTKEAIAKGIETRRRNAAAKQETVLPLDAIPDLPKRKCEKQPRAANNVTLILNGTVYVGVLREAK